MIVYTRDTIQIRVGPRMANHDQIPEICRKEVIEWDQEIKRLGEILMGVLCEGLGVDTGRLMDMSHDIFGRESDSWQLLSILPTT